MYRLSNIVRVIKFRRLRWASHIGRVEEVKSTSKILTGKPTGKRPRLIWEDQIRMDLKEIVIITRNWVDSVQGRGC